MESLIERTSICMGATGTSTISQNCSRVNFIGYSCSHDLDHRTLKKIFIILYSHLLTQIEISCVVPEYESNMNVQCFDVGLTNPNKTAICYRNKRNGFTWSRLRIQVTLKLITFPIN